MKLKVTAVSDGIGNTEGSLNDVEFLIIVKSPELNALSASKKIAPFAIQLAPVLLKT